MAPQAVSFVIHALLPTSTFGIDSPSPRWRCSWIFISRPTSNSRGTK